MKMNEQLLNKIQKMDSIQLLELIVLAKTGGEYDLPLKARIVARAHSALKELVNDLARVKGSAMRDVSSFLPIDIKKRK